ncbi:hypothetical protein JI742_06635 [Piscinibacter sp. Jin2]|uniref:Uncharacterized protein n=1 Tax=Aquariibacter lacus TaxID=2801332 RepID=A0A9X0XGK7_9BURK|nr:hypothetical protein [Piscinibacter lacus]MBL0719563.1 hypothetical protein [Piscinibacter lacus]
MEQAQIDFLDKLVTLNGQQLVHEKKEGQKKALLNKLVEQREQNRSVLEKGASLLMVQEGSGRTMKLTDLENRDQTKEFDHDDQRDGYRLRHSQKPGEEYAVSQDEQAHFDVSNLVNQQVASLELALDDEGKPLFTPEEIAAQVFDPMVREGLISETMVPDKYSRTRELLEGTFEAYGKRLKRDKKSKAGNLFSENLGLMTSSMSFMLTTVGGAMDSKVGGDKVAKEGAKSLKSSWSRSSNVKDIKDALSGSHLNEGNQALKFTTQAFSFCTDFGLPFGQEAHNKFFSGDGEGSEGEAPRLPAAELALALFGAAAAELAQQFDAKAGIGLEVSSAFGAKIDRAGIANLIQSGSLDGIPASLVHSLGQALGRLDPGVKDSAETLAAAAETFGVKLAQALAGEPVSKALKSPDAKALGDLFGAAGKVAAQAALTPEVIQLFTDAAVQDKVKNAASDMMAEEFSEPGPLAEDERLHAKSHADHQADWLFKTDGKDSSGDGGRWVCQVCEAENSGDNPEIYAGMLQRRIEQLERDKELLEWSTKLVGLGIDTAANFIAPLAAVGSAVKMAKNILQAGMRTRDLVVFIEKRNGLFNAASAYSQPVKNFIANSRSQMLHYMANAAFEAVKMIGAILQCGGITAPAGLAVTTAGSIAQSLEAVIYEIDKRVKLEIAWRTYRSYLARPENRRLGLVAIKSNPTLAKYAVAWGAVIKKDRLVVDFVSACGLTPETLKDPNAGVDEVVKYLEARMPDDTVVTGRSGGLDVDGASLSHTSWMTLQTQAVKEEALAPGGTGLIVACLRKWAKEGDGLEARAAKQLDPKVTDPVAIQQAKEDRTLAKTQAENILESLAGALRKYQPKTTKGQACPAMVRVVAAFASLSQAQAEKVQGWIPEPP